MESSRALTELRKGRMTGLSAGAISAGLLMTAMLVGVVGCKSDQPQMTAVSDTGPDPAEANMAPVDASEAEAAATGAGLSPVPAGIHGVPAAPSSSARRVGPASSYSAAGYQTTPNLPINESQQAAQSYGEGQQAPAPVERQLPQGYPQQGGYPPGDGGYANGQPNGTQDNGQYSNDDAQTLSDQIYSDVDPNQQAQEPPPPLPVYDQPPAPADDYLWTPGYWGYAPAGYYWVPGAWCASPYVGALWTPGWWGPYGRGYGFHRGYWGRHIGFYGGVPYGFGYYGTGYEGGYWNGNHFAYNRAVSNVNVTTIHNVYNRTVIVNNVRINNSVTNRYVNNTVINNRVSYNGGRGGIQARPVPAEMAAFRAQRTPPMTAQTENQRAAATNRGQFFQQNQGRPQMATAGRVLAADRVAAPPVNNQPMRFGSGVAGGVRQGGVIAPGERPTPGARSPGQPQSRPGQVGATQQGSFGDRPNSAQQSRKDSQSNGQTQGMQPQRTLQSPLVQTQRPGNLQQRSEVDGARQQQRVQAGQQRTSQVQERARDGQQQMNRERNDIREQQRSVQQPRFDEQQDGREQRPEAMQQRAVEQQQLQQQQRSVPQSQRVAPQPQQMQPQRQMPQAQPRSQPQTEAPRGGGGRGGEVRH